MESASLGGHLCLKKKAQLKKGDHVTSLNRNQEGGGCLVTGEWLSGSELGCLSLAVLPTCRENSTCGLPRVSPCTVHMWLVRVIAS